MALNTELWKNKIKESLQGWKKRFDKAGANSAYYFLSAISFAPIIQAAHSGDWGALSLLGITLGGTVGTNLLANMVQNLKDKSDAEIAQELAAETQINPALKNEIDALLEKLDTLPKAEAALADADKAWFEETIQNELNQAGSKIIYNATLKGDGAIAQGDRAVALGKNARYTAGDHIENYHQAPDPGKGKEAEANDARCTYLEKLRRHCQALPLAALGGQENSDEEITLDKVYTNLDTTIYVKSTDLEKLRSGEKVKLTESAIAKESPEIQERMGEKKDVEPLPLWDAVRATPRVVVLGDPGAGKSTFARKLLGLQAATLLEECDPLQGFDGGLLPIMVVLRELSLRLAKLDLSSLSAGEKKKVLLEEVRAHLADDLKHNHAETFIPHMMQALESGQALLVLDGLDEVPQSLRQVVRQVVVALRSEYQLERLIITSRIRSYTGNAVFKNTQTFTIRPFDKEKIKDFVNGWYRAQAEMGRLTEKDRQERTDDLIQATASRNLLEIASNPMMLTSMAIIHQKEIGLPRERVRLYKLVVDVLLNRWQKYRFGEKNLAPSPALTAFLMDEMRLLSALERLAYEAHRAGKGEKESADLPRLKALSILEDKEYLGKIGLAEEFLDYVDQRAGLLKGNGGELDKPTSYSFPHRTFQEYLAGCYMVRDRNPSREYFQRAGEGDYWALAAQLGAEELYFNRRGIHTLLDLVYQLLPSSKPANEQEERAALWSGLFAHVAGEEEIKTDQDSPEGGQKYLSRLSPRLVGLLGGELPPLERAEAGRILSKLGDPRQDVLLPEEILFCQVPAGEFRMGDKGKEFLLDLPEFFISRYPITNAQYKTFMDEGGYSQREYWKEAEQEKYWKEGTFKGKYDKNARIAPVSYGEPFNLSNHPVVGISWYEALAFVRWMDASLQRVGQLKLWKAKKSLALPKGYHIALPSEAEWEKAARGTDGREYPWKGKFDSNKANTGETGINSTSAVGCFPQGESPFGLQELSGNVWEWTRSVYKEYPYDAGDGREDLNSSDDRVLRGGAFYNYRLDVRCAYRYGNLPNDGDDDLGFRVIVSPILHRN